MIKCEYISNFNLDSFDVSEWPNYVVAVPSIGDFIQNRTGICHKVAGITHSSKRHADGHDVVEEAFIIITLELH